VNICYLNMPIEYYSPTCGGAVSTVMMQQAKELLSRGHRVQVLTLVNHEPQYQVGEVIPLQSPLREQLSPLLRRIYSLESKLKQWDWPCYGPYLRSALKTIKRLSPRPDAVIVHNDLVAPKYLRKHLPHSKIVVLLHNEQRTRQSALTHTIAATDTFATVSDYIAQWTIRQHKIPPEKVVTVRNGVDLDSFHPPESLNGQTDHSLRVLYVGRIDPNKGPDLAADAVTELKKQGLSLSITWAGPVWWHGAADSNQDPYFRTLKSKMDAAGATYLGHLNRDQVPEVMRNHDVACVLSRSNEPFGLVALEAMACGCAVLASNRGGLPEACGDAALFANPDDLSTVVSSLKRLATDRDLLNRCKRNSLQRAQKASWSTTVDRLEQILSGESPA